MRLPIASFLRSDIFSLVPAVLMPAEVACEATLVYDALGILVGVGSERVESEALGGCFPY